MISTFTALIDANVFYGARLRSLVIYLAQVMRIIVDTADDPEAVTAKQVAITICVLL